MSANRLYTLAPRKPNAFGKHVRAHSSIKAKTLRAGTITSGEVVADSLSYLDGTTVVEDDNVLFDEVATQQTPNNGTGRVWLRNNDPTRLVFTNDGGVETVISPGLGDVLDTDNDGGGLNILNAASLTFSGGVRIGNDTASSTVTASTDTVIGQGASSTAGSSVVVGTGASSALAQTVVVGAGSSIASGGATADSIGGVVVGYNSESWGPGICIGHDNVNRGDVQDGGAANIFVGRSITSQRQQVSELDATGLYVALDIAGTPVLGQYLVLYSANDATQYYFWTDNGTAANDPGAAGTGVEVDVVTGVTTDANVAEAFRVAINGVADFAAVRTDNLVRVTNAASGPSTDIANVDIASLTVETLERGVVAGSSIAVGENVVPAPESVQVGFAATSRGGSSHVCIGDNAETGGNGSIAIGYYAKCYVADNFAAGNGISLGVTTYSTDDLSVNTGAYNRVTGRAGVAIGERARATGGTSICISTSGYIVSSSASNAIVLGSRSSSALASSVALGRGITSRAPDEFAARGFRFVRGTVSTSTSAITTILTFPTSSNEVLHVDGTVTAYRRTNDTTYMASIEDFHFRNKAGTLTRAAGLGSLIEDTSEASYVTTVDVNGTDIRVRVTGIAGHTVDWVCLLRVYCTPLA